jgi:hypothetical protein
MSSSRRAGDEEPVIEQLVDRVGSEVDPEQTRVPSLPEEPNTPPPTEDVTYLRVAAHHSGLVLAAMLGTLIRLGMDALALCKLCGDFVCDTRELTCV